MDPVAPIHIRALCVWRGPWWEGPEWEVGGGSPMVFVVGGRRRRAHRWMVDEGWSMEKGRALAAREWKSDKRWAELEQRRCCMGGAPSQHDVRKRGSKQRERIPEGLVEARDVRTPHVHMNARGEGWVEWRGTPRECPRRLGRWFKFGHHLRRHRHRIAQAHLQAPNSGPPPPFRTSGPFVPPLPPPP